MIYLLLLLLLLLASTTTTSSEQPCLSFCGNLTVSFPFSPLPGCGHPNFRELFFCINDVLLLHLSSSSSYRVLSLDYPFRSVVLHDPSMSTCHHLPPPPARPHGFLIDPWRLPYLHPATGTAFLLLGCDASSPLFQGFPDRKTVCRNESGIGCEEFASCPSWAESGRWGAADGRVDCCTLPFSSVAAVNLTKLGCQGYSSAYVVAPLRGGGAATWRYGIRLRYNVPVEQEELCRACEATGGSCGYDQTTLRQLCICSGWNSTTTCDSGPTSMSSRPSWTPSLPSVFFMSTLFLHSLHLGWNK